MRNYPPLPTGAPSRFWCRRGFLACLVFLVNLTLVTTAETAEGTARKPNILIIFVDDMGYGDPGCYNPESKIATPNIDRLAREGMRFTDAHAPGAVCHPSRYGLLTGCYPFRTDVSVWPKKPVIEEGRMTIASLLRSHGYRTEMVGKWHLGFRESGYDQPLPGGPVDRGFDTFFGIRASTDIPPYFYIRGDRAVAPPTAHIAANQSEDWSPIQGAFWREGGIAPGLQLKDVLPRFTEEAIQVIKNHSRTGGGRALMLYLAYPAPHTPWLPSPEFAGRSKAGLYGDFAEMVDAMVGRVIAALEAEGMTGETLVIFASDNGPVWYDHDVKRFGHDSAAGLRGMKGDAWEGGHRMPFIVRWPGRVKAGSVSRQTICYTDLLATFAATIGAQLPRGAGGDSFDLLPVLLGLQPETKPIRGPVVIPSSGGYMTIRSGPWKLIEGLGSGGFSVPRKIKPSAGGPEGQLYNLRDDPGETRNLWLDQPDIVERLRAEMDRIRKSGTRPESLEKGEA
ncbi:MAG: arylsulfatase [Planctomycetes bacterium]|nr:arylsulfatase [Planctomycetota bacterium]